MCPRIRKLQEPSFYKDLQRTTIPFLPHTTAQEPHLDLKIAPQTLTCLRGYPFQGNIRELRNILERATLLADAGVILPEHLPEACRGVADTEISASEGTVSLAEMERRYLRQAVKDHCGTHRQLADTLGISERTLYRKLQKTGL